jgi:hypothetical protein
MFLLRSAIVVLAVIGKLPRSASKILFQVVTTTTVTLIFIFHLLICSFLAVVKGLTLPQPVKGPTKFANLAETLKINAGLAIQHLPNTDSIVAVWIEQGASILTGNFESVS